MRAARISSCNPIRELLDQLPPLISPEQAAEDAAYFHEEAARERKRRKKQTPKRKANR